MKKLKIPQPQYWCTSADGIQTTLEGTLRSKKKSNHNFTLYGAYKLIRTMASYAVLGDYVVLSQCVEFLKRKGLSITEKEIYRCFKYFEDYERNCWGLYKNLSSSLMGGFDSLAS